MLRRFVSWLSDVAFAFLMLAAWQEGERECDSHDWEKPPVERARFAKLVESSADEREGD